MVDEIAVPDRFEQAVGEAEGENVLCRLLAQEMIDAEDLLLIEHFMQLRIERPGAGEVDAERLLHDATAPLDQPGFGQQPYGRQVRVGRDREIVDTPRLPIASLL